MAPIFLFVHSLQEQLLTINIDTEQTIQDLYNIVWDKKGNKCGKLIFNGHLLKEPYVKIKDIENISHNQTIFYINNGSMQHIMDINIKLGFIHNLRDVNINSFYYLFT